jgi:hypothetical protein
MPNDILQKTQVGKDALEKSQGGALRMPKRESVVVALPQGSMTWERGRHNNYDFNSIHHRLLEAQNKMTSVESIEVDGKSQKLLGRIHIPQKITNGAAFPSTSSREGVTTVLASAMRGYFELAKEKLQASTDVKILLAPAGGNPPSLAQAMVSSSTYLNEVIERGFNLPAGSVTSKLVSNTNGQKVYRFSLPGQGGNLEVGIDVVSGQRKTGSAEILTGVQTMGAHAVLCLDDTSNNNVRGILSAESTRTALYHALDPDMIVNSTLERACSTGTARMLSGGLLVEGDEPILLSDCSSFTEFKSLQSAYSAGYRFSKSITDGKSTVSISRVSPNGTMSPIGASISLPTPKAGDIDAQLSYTAERNSQLARLVEVMKSVTPISIPNRSGGLGVAPVSIGKVDLSTFESSKLESHPLGIIKQGQEAGFEISYTGLQKGQGGVEEERYSISIVSGKERYPLGDSIVVAKGGVDYQQRRDVALADAIKARLENPPRWIKLALPDGLAGRIPVDEVSSPELAKMLEANPDAVSIVSTREIANARGVNSTTLHTVEVRDTDGSSVAQRFDVLFTTAADFQANLVEQIRLDKSGAEYLSLGTNDAAVSYRQYRTTDPALFDLLQEAAGLGYELVDMGSTNRSRTFGLRNLTSYRYEINDQTKEYKRITGEIELQFSVSTSGGLMPSGEVIREAMEESLAKDDASTSIKSGNRTQSRPGERKTDYLTRRKTEQFLHAVRQSGSLLPLVQQASSLQKSGYDESQRQIHSGMHYRYADVLGDMLVDAAEQRNLDFVEDIPRVRLATLSLLGALYSQSPEVFSVLTDKSSGLSQEEANERLLRLGLAGSKMILDRRAATSTEPVLSPDTRVVAFTQRAFGVDAKQLARVLLEHGVQSERMDVHILDSSQMNKEQAGQLATAVKDPSAPTFVYIWGHGGFSTSSVIDIGQLSTQLVSSAPRSVSSDGKLEIDLSKVHIFLDECYSATAAGSIESQVSSLAQKQGIEMAGFPRVAGTTQEREFARSSTIDGISLFLETLDAIPKGETISRGDLLTVADALLEHSTNLVERWEHGRDPSAQYSRRLMMGSHTPLMYDSNPTSSQKLIEDLNKYIEEMRGEGEEVLRAPRPAKNERMRLHLSRNSPESPSKAA